MRFFFSQLGYIFYNDCVGIELFGFLVFLTEDIHNVCLRCADEKKLVVFHVWLLSQRSRSK